MAKMIALRLQDQFQASIVHPGSFTGQTAKIPKTSLTGYRDLAPLGRHGLAVVC
jgi:hypothetical protein